MSLTPREQQEQNVLTRRRQNTGRTGSDGFDDQDVSQIETAQPQGQPYENLEQMFFGAPTSMNAANRAGVQRAPAANTSVQQQAAATKPKVHPSVTFHNKAKYGPVEVTANGGAYTATYIPKANKLKVEVRGGVIFEDGLTVDSSGNAVASRPELDAQATAANALTGSRKKKFIQQFQWSTATKKNWLPSLEKSVEKAWSQKHQFHIERPDWTWIGAKVTVDVKAHSGARKADDHLEITTVRVPDGNTDIGAYATMGGSSFDGEMLLASHNVKARPDNLLRHSVSFAAGSATLDAGSQSFLTQWIASFQGAPTNPASRQLPLQLKGYASGDTSEKNKKLAQDRIDAVQAYLTVNGFTNVSGSIVETPRSGTTNEVTLIAGDGKAQVVAAHEFGHAMGSGDEYAVSSNGLISGTGATAGGAATHDGLAKNLPNASGAKLPGAIFENNDNIMSLGNSVQPQHYAMFHAGLQQVTSINDWALGPTKGKKPTTEAPKP
jgi:outer membrane protein OmpA-like peptidoglycan-associated protein